MKNAVFFTVCYIVILSVDLLCRNIPDLEPFRVITKPSIISSLLIFFFINSKHLIRQQRNFMIAALVFYLLGDLFFLNYNDNLSFMLGFVFFMIANLMYVVAFQFKVQYHLGKLAILSVVILSYAFWMLKTILPQLGDFFIPVLVFMVIIFSSLQSSFFRWNQVPTKSFVLVLIGATIYVITQTSIALNKFAEPLPYESFLTMFTYGVAHYCIVMGILKEPRRPIEFES